MTKKRTRKQVKSVHQRVIELTDRMEEDTQETFIHAVSNAMSEETAAALSGISYPRYVRNKRIAIEFLDFGTLPQLDESDHLFCADHWGGFICKVREASAACQLGHYEGSLASGLSAREMAFWAKDIQVLSLRFRDDWGKGADRLSGSGGATMDRNEQFL